MCQTIPFKIIEISGASAKAADCFQNKRTLNISALSNTRNGDWVLASADLALQIISEKDAKKLSKLYKKIV